MGVCASCVPDEDISHPLEPTVDAGVLLPPPPARTKSDFDLPRSLKGSLALKQVPQQVDISAYAPLDELTLSPEPTYIGLETFFALIQHKTYRPHVYRLYDLQGRRRFMKGHIKYATSLFDIDDPHDLDKLKSVRQSTIDRLNNSIGGRIVLLYDIETDPASSPLLSWVSECFRECIDPPRSIFILNTSFHHLCTRYPHAHAFSTLTMPGATEILFGEKAFRLYIADDRAVRANQKTLTSVYDIQTVILLTSNPVKFDSEGFKVINIQIDDHFCLGLVQALESLSELTTRSLSVLLAAPIGSDDAIYVALFFLVQLGFEPKRALEHISIRCCFPDTLSMPDEVLHRLHSFYEAIPLSLDMQGAYNMLLKTRDESKENQAQSPANQLSHA